MTSPLRLLGIAALVLVVLASLGVWLVETGRWTPSAAAAYPVRGIDVSRYQGTIDWTRVAADGVDFAYIKATEGGDWTDPEFAANWEGAREAGIVRGGYHFFTFCRAPEEQARHALATIPDEPGTLPLAVDVEYGGNCEGYESRDQIQRDLDRFIEIVTEARGEPPTIYAVFDAYDDFIEGRYPESPVWAQNVFFKPNLEGGREWVFWQYDIRGRVDGIEGDVDLNVFRRGPLALQRLTGG